MAKKRRTKEEQMRHNRTIRRKVTGGVFVGFALIGIISVVALISSGVGKLFNNTTVKADFEKQIEFVVAMDPSPFVITDSPNDDQLLEAAVWTSLLTYPEESRTYNDNGQLLLPAIEVTTAAAKMYSSEYKLTNRTFSDVDLKFEYAEASGLYTMPSTSLVGTFYPQVVAITREGSYKVLSVAYMSPGLQDYYTGVRDPENDKIVKYMEYVMVREGGKWLLHEVRTPVLDSTPSLEGNK